MEKSEPLSNKRASGIAQESNYDLTRLKWLDPCSDARFLRNEPIIREDANVEYVLQNIKTLTSEIFDHLSVYEQFSETTSRGATADVAKRLDLPGTRSGLLEVEQTLWDVYRVLKEERESFVDKQLRSLRFGRNSKDLRVHIGSGANELRGWLNIDAGGADLTLNVNWGLPLPDECARFVYSAHLLEHLRYNDQAPVFVREVHRILAKSGTVRFVVPDIRKLLHAYVTRDQEFFRSRNEYYPLSKGFVDDGVATLDYILLFCGAASQSLNYNHKFGYDSNTLRKLLIDAGFETAVESEFQRSEHVELRVDDIGYNSSATTFSDQHYSLFVEATK